MAVTELKLPVPIEELRKVLRSHGVVKASVFGSYARSEAGQDSDLDLLVEMEASRSLFDLGALQYELEELAGKKVDVTTKLHPRFQSFITPDLVEIL